MYCALICIHLIMLILVTITISKKCHQFQAESSTYLKVGVTLNALNVLELDLNELCPCFLHLMRLFSFVPFFLPNT